MPTLYRIVRDDGTTASPLPEGVAGAALRGEGPGELACSYLALLRDDAFEPIRHPIEDHDLHSFGETFASALRKGILFRLEPHLCRDCGRTTYVPTMENGLLGTLGSCLGPPIVVLVVIVVVHVAWPERTPLALLCGLPAWIAAAWAWRGANVLIQRMRFGARIERTQVTCCRACGCRRLAEVSRVIGKTLQLKNGSVVRVEEGGRS